MRKTIVPKMETTETGQQAEAARAPTPMLPRAYLVYSPALPGSAPRILTLSAGETPIGRERADGDGLEIKDFRISRLNSTLCVSPALTVCIRDERSKNGTSVNGQLLPSGGTRRLQDGDVIRVGDSLLVIDHEAMRPPPPRLPSLLGCAPTINALAADIQRVAPDPATVLILGETGTGKELVAQALHQCSGRAGDFIAVNCAAIPEALAESQLFGSVAGSFTGARPQPGFFRAAHDGTLFLDEVGELPLGLQAKLLRAIQERAVVPVGAVKPIACNVRLLAATNRDLAGAVAAYRFRADLYARLAGVVMHLPALRARRQDILLLLRHALGPEPVQLSPKLAETLLLYAWPLNVREVFQVADQLRLLGPTDALWQRLAPPLPIASPESASTEAASGSSEATAGPPAAPSGPGGLRDTGPVPSRDELQAILARQKGVIRRVAAELGCSRRHVGRLIERYGLDLSGFRLL